jgi:hypothetical protein
VNGFALGDGSRCRRTPFRIADERKPLYHAAAVFASNYVVTVTALAEELERTAGVPDPLGALTPLQEATLANVHRVGPAEALTGPAVRGDAHPERNLGRSRCSAEPPSHVRSPTSRALAGAGPAAGRPRRGGARAGGDRTCRDGGPERARAGDRRIRPDDGSVSRGPPPLLRRARARDRVVSIFVNPLQFGEAEDRSISAR